MIQKETIEKLINEKLEGTKHFIAEAVIKPGNKIQVFLDSYEKVNIQDCVGVSRHIEGNLDREVEDYELMVSSAGMDEPFKVPQQYEKNIGRNVSLKMVDGKKQEGILKSRTITDTVIVQTITERNEKGKKQTKEEETTIPNTEIKETKLIFSFKF